MKSNLKAFAALCLLLLVASAAHAAETVEEITVRGRLARTVEAGGWVLNTKREKYLLLNAGEYRNQNWFRENAEVEAVGETQPDVITTFQEGVPFRARTLQPINNTSQNQTVGAAQNQMPIISGTTQVTVSGDAVVQAQPDTAIITIAVVTQSANAQTAQRENARRSDAVVRAVRQAAGAEAEIKTSGYTLQPQRVYRQNQPPTITGYEARNAVTVTLPDLERVGAVIDAASGAGANNVDNLQFTLRRDRPARDQALTEATRAAMSKAQALATALGGRIVRIVEVQEAGTIRPPVPVYRREAAATSMAMEVATPIEVGALDVRSQVQMTAEVEVRP